LLAVTPRTTVWLLIMIDADVRVVFRRYDGSLHWHNTMKRLGEDSHGIWLGAANRIASPRIEWVITTT
jgi:hypothetical protein